MAKLVLKKVVKKAEETVKVRHSIGREVNYPVDVCFNPLRFLNFDCPCCQFYKPCKAICKDDYGYAKRRPKKVEEDDEVNPNIAPAPEEVKVKKTKPVVNKPEKIKAEPKKKSSKIDVTDLDGYEFDL